MSTSKLPFSLAALVLAGGAGIVTIQERASQLRGTELAALADENREVATLQAENQAMLGAAQEAQRLQGADARLAYAQKKVAALHSELDGRSAKTPTSAGASRMQSTHAFSGAAYVAGTQDGSPVVGFNHLDQVPIAVTQARPEYPPDFHQAGLSAEVVVDCVIGDDGAVHNAFALSTTQPGFEEAAVQAVSQWTFKPGVVAGQAVNAHIQIPIVFSSAADPTPAPTATTWF
jgi:TonB family protein